MKTLKFKFFLLAGRPFFGHFAALIGILGTFLVNLFRLTFPTFIAVVYHDHLAAIVTIIWLFVFW